jgi:outer membrane protein assembly factor BamB
MPGTTSQIALLGLVLGLVAACGGDAASPLPPAAPGAVASPNAPDGAEIDRLRALGYVEISENDVADARAGVVFADRGRSSPGYNFYLSSGVCRADLVDAEGVLLRSWQHLPCRRWASATLLGDGGLVVVGQHPGKGAPPGHYRRHLLRLAPDGSVVWEVEAPVHHHVSLTAEGRILTLTRRLRRFPDIRHDKPPDVAPEIPVVDNGVAVFDGGGERLEERSLVEALSRSPGVFRFQAVAPKVTGRGQAVVDLLHTNAVQWISPGPVRGPEGLFGRAGVLVCMRHQDTVAFVDWEAQRAVWAWGQGILAGPHDAHVLPGGTILVFDNGLGRDRSRVVEVDPRSGRIVWEYTGEPARDFYSRIRGASQRLRNGNTLVSDSMHGRVFEVTPSGEVVWDFRTPHRNPEGRPYNVVFMRRYTPAELPPALASPAPRL